jgi:predicted O-methyltransferase YrrM
MAPGLAEGGEIHTIEMRGEDAERARQNFNRSNQGDRIILHIGNALEIIPSLDQTWDLVFIDADKVSYELYYQMVLPKVRAGGVILADNVLFHGQVVEDPVKGKNAKAMHAFNQMVSADQRVEKMILTLRDGLMLIRKK